MTHIPTDTSTLAVLTVTFNPDIEKLGRQIASLPADTSAIIVDNASAPDTLCALQQLLNSRPRTTLIKNQSNVGLAAALNQAAKHAMTHLASVEYFLLMDQDSIPAPGAIASLLAAHIELEVQGLKVGCVGPRLVDAATGLQHGFHQMKGWRWTRTYPATDDRHQIDCTNLNGSGTLMRATLMKSLGGLDEPFFIDHIDTEWAFRVLDAGWKLYGIPWVAFDHSMGERSFRFWLFGWKIWPQRSPKRHYYLFRNAVWLMKRDYVPRIWKTWALAKLLLTMAAHAIGDPLRSQQLREMLAGLDAGINLPSKK
jgi:rhamnosyltransferase